MLVRNRQFECCRLQVLEPAYTSDKLCRHLTPREDYRSFRPFPVSPSTLKEAFNILNIPKVFLRVLLSNLPFAMRFTPKQNGKPTGSGTLHNTQLSTVTNSLPKSV